MSRIAGVDGYRDGWVVAILTGRTVEWMVCANAGEVLRRTADCAAVGVDIPMGLPEHGYRPCDRAARESLGTARSSVFLSPPRAVLRASPYDYRMACDLARTASGKAISKQTWNIMNKIRDWDRLLRGEACSQERVIEVHPELSVRTLAPGQSFAPKRSARGAGQRIAALSTFADPTGLADIPAGPSLDDALDALAVAYSANRFGRGEERRLGGERDSTGLVMRIVV